MRSFFKEKDAQELIKKYSEVPKELALRVYTSRLIGADDNLVLHGGGNTSVKIRQQDIFGEQTDVIFVKGSGWDLAAIEPEGFVGLNLGPLRNLRALDLLSDEEIENQLLVNRLSARAPDPSVEALLHAFLPHKYIDHTHADAILTLTNQRLGEALVREALGDNVAVLPYAKSGLPLAKAVVEEYEKRPEIEAIVILNHGIFTFAEDAKTSYEKMIEYVGRAEKFIEEQIRGKKLVTPRVDVSVPENAAQALVRCAQVIRGVCAHRDASESTRRFYLEIRTSPDLVEASLSAQARDICSSGVLTPDHAVRTKNRMAFVESIPEDDGELRRVVGEEVEAFTKDYHRYFQCHSQLKETEYGVLDLYPRLVLVSGLGLFALGFTRKEARIAADISEHTIRVKLRAGVIGKYEPISESHVFEMEYWPPQLKKLGSAKPGLLQGQVAFITGAGGAIGCGVADRLLAAGAVVALSDLDEKRLGKVCAHLTEKYDQSLIESIVCDVTDYSSVEKAYGELSRRVGGVDIVVPNAGVAHVAKIEDLEPERLDQVTAVNFRGTFNTIKASIPAFRRQGTGGNIVVISSKNVFDPGAAFGAYSATKAAAHQIAKIAALELAELGVRVNMVNPDAVFGDEKISSGLWDLVGPERMKSRGLDEEGLLEYYRQRNLLKERVLAEHIGNAVVFFASNQTPTTGATLPIDGGIPSAFPR